MRSIAASQLRTLLVGGIALSLVGSAMIIALARHALTGQFDDNLIAQAEFLTTLVDYSEEGVLEFDEAATDASMSGDSENPGYFQVWRVREGDSGDRLETMDRSESLKDAGAELMVVAPGAPDVPVIERAETPDGRPARAVTLTMIVREIDDEMEASQREAYLALRTRVVIRVVAGTEPMLVPLLRIGAGVAAACVLMIAGFTGLALVTVRRGLRPLDDANAQVASVDASNLVGRIDVGGAPEEIRPLLDGINELLERLESSFTRERVSRAMLAHELRNPVAELLMIAEVAAKWPDDPERMRLRLGEIVECARELQRLITTLLRVVRVQAGHEDPRSERVRADIAIAEVIECSAGIASARRLTVERSIEEGATARTDPDLLRFVFNNLVTNAVEHTPEGGRVAIALTNGGGSVRLSCANDVRDPGAIDCDGILAPFRTGEDADRGDHSGIGLSATSTICRSMGATLGLSVEGGRFIAELEIEAAGA